MLWISLFSLVLAIAAVQGQNTCTLKYYTVNTFRKQNNFSFSCYESNSKGCTIYYTPPSTGCSGNFLKFIGSVPDNETRVLTYNSGFQLGGGFCSDNQIAVSFEHETDVVPRSLTLVYLPRATEAGTKFYMALYVSVKKGDYKCTFSALSSAARVSVDYDGDVESFTINSYGNAKYEFAYAYVPTHSTRVLKIDSDNPIIVSCIANTTQTRLVTLQPVSSKPLMMSNYIQSYFSVVISDCSTNQLITNNSRVNVIATRQDGSSCEVAPPGNVKSNDIQYFHFIDFCAVLIEPVDNSCVSVGLQNIDLFLISVGIPEAKFSTRFSHYPVDKLMSFYSFLEVNCTLYLTNLKTPLKVNVTWLGGDLMDKVAFSKVNNLWSGLSAIECTGNILIIVTESPYGYPFLAGYQTEDLWQPFFDSSCIAPSAGAQTKISLPYTAAFFCISLAISSSRWTIVI